MTKRSNRPPRRREKNGSGCLWGLINIFDFNNGRSPRRLISIKQNFSKQDGQPTVTKSDPPCFKGIYEGADIDEESKTWIAHSDRQPSVKKLMEEEMSSSHDSESESKFSDRKARFLARKNDNEMSKTHKRTCSQESDPIQNTHSLNPERNSRRSSWSEEKLSETTKSICQKLKGGVGLMGVEEPPHFKEHVKHLRTINNESCRNLLQDPDSVLANYVQTILDSHEVEQPNNNTSYPPSGHMVGRTNFFSRKIKSQAKNLEASSSKTIVILKPGCTSSPSKTTKTIAGLVPLHKDQSRKHSSQFYFSEMKRMFRNALGKRSEPIESRTGSGSPLEKEKDSVESGAGSTTDAEVRINMVANKHLSQMLKKVGQKGRIFRSSELKSLAEVLSFSDHISISGRDLKKNYSVNSQPGSPIGNRCRRGENDPVWWFKSEKDSSPDQSSDSPAAPSCISEEDGGAKSDFSSSCSSSGNNHDADSVTKSSPSEPNEPEEDIVLDISVVSGGGSFIVQNGENDDDLFQAGIELVQTDCSIIQENNGYMSSPGTEKLPFINSETLPSSPPRGLSDPSNSEDAEKPEHTSPVSVLDPFFSQDYPTPSTSKERLREGTGVGMKERVLDYVGELMKARNLDWEIQRVDRAIAQQECYSSAASVETDLLSDCVEEVLGGVLGRVLDPAPWAGPCSWIRPEMLGEEVWAGVRWHLLLTEGTPNLEQTVRRDFHGSGWWVDHWPPGMESVGVEVGRAIEDDLVEDTVCEFVDILL